MLKNLRRRVSGTTIAMWIIGTAYFAATLIPLANPSFRRMNRAAA